MVTHLTTNPPVRCLNRAERTGSLVVNVLWSYVEDVGEIPIYIAKYGSETYFDDFDSSFLPHYSHSCLTYERIEARLQ
jgi:hypothetical protein